MLALEANEWGIWLVNETDQGTEFISCVDWKIVAVHIKKHLEEQEKNDV